MKALFRLFLVLLLFIFCFTKLALAAEKVVRLQVQGCMS